MPTPRLPAADHIEDLHTLIAALALAVLLSAVFLDVLSRELLGYPILWLQEVSIFSFMWLTFSGSAVGVRRGTHYQLDLIQSVFKSQRVIRSLRFVALLLSFTFGAILFYQGIGFATLGFKRVSRPSGFPLFYVFMALPICGLSMCYFLIEKLLHDLSMKE